LEQQDLNKRLLLALVLSFMVFVGYSYLFPVKNLKPTQTEKLHTSHTQSAPSVVDDKSVASVSYESHAMDATMEKALPSLAIIKSKNFVMNIDKFGRISQMELLEKKYQTKEGKSVKMLAPKAVKPLEIRFADTELNEEAFKTPYVNNGKRVINVENGVQTLTLKQSLSGVTITKKITVKPTGEYKVDILLSKDVPYFVTPGHRPEADNSRYLLVRGALIKGSDNIINTIEDGDAEGTERFKNAKIASAFDRYVASIFFAFDKGLDVSVLKEQNGDPLIFVKGAQNFTLHAYIGTKDYEVLKDINPELTDAIEFGFFSFLSKPFYKVLLWIHSHIGNWGWAIIFFTLLVKLVLFPLSYKGMMSMQKMKDLAPKMKEIKAKYKDDPAKMNAQMMEMYKKHGANPMGGCLPMILQIPVFFALYRVLLNAVELEGAPWILWIHNLAQMDPYFILPVLMGASMWFQQRVTPQNHTDPMVEKMMKWFPVIMTVFFVSFPAGLVLYWLMNNLFTIGQQYFINHMYAKHKEAATLAHKKKKD
jgi:YidC/Oxa1 family membrane protein insertase